MKAPPRSSRRRFLAVAVLTTGIVLVGHDASATELCTSESAVQDAHLISLAGRWELVDTDYFIDPQSEQFQEGVFWQKARQVEVPCAIQAGIYKKDWIYFSHNCLKTGWILDRQWWYRKRFSVGAVSQWATLTFEGFSYEASIWVNGTLLGHHPGMYGAEFAVDGLLQEGENELIVAIDPAPQVLRTDREDEVYHYPSANPKRVQETLIPAACYERYWGNHIPLGIMRPVRLSQHGPVVLSDLFVRTVEIDPRSAKLELSAVVVNRSGAAVRGQIDWRCDTASFHSGNMLFQPGVNTFSSEFIIENPRLWWTWDLGKQEMYELEAWVSASGKRLAEAATRFGIRTIDWQRNDRSEPYQHPQILCLNGKKLYLFGANFVQTDALGHSPAELWREKTLVRIAKHQGLNCLRLHETVMSSWDFFEHCDEAGILVFQDCLLNRRHQFVEKTLRKIDTSVLEEQVGRLVRQLRNHPCLAAWKGGNELFAHTHPAYGDPHTSRLVSNVQENVVKRNDPSRRYFRTSPERGHGENHQYHFRDYIKYAAPISPERLGSRDQPSVPTALMIEEWKKLPVGYEEYIERAGKDDLLISEFLGAPDMPDLPCLRRFVDREELADWAKRPAGTFKSLNPLKTYEGAAFFLPTQPFLPEAYTLGLPETLEDFIAYTQLARSLHGSFAVGVYRSRTFHNSGFFYFALNEPLPGLNFGTVDYYLRPKRTYFDLQQALQRVAGFALYDKKEFERGQVFHASLVAVNATEREEECVVTAQIWDPALKLRAQEVREVQCGGNTSVEAGEISYEVPNEKEIFFLRVVLETKSGRRSETQYWLNAKGTFQRGALPSTTLDVQKNGRRLTIKNTGQAPAFRVEIESTSDQPGLLPSASGFWLEPGRERVVDLVPMTDNIQPVVFRVQAWNSAGTGLPVE